jgi:hypothetical protein
MPKCRRPRAVLMEPISEETAERVAAIIGASSAMSLALADLRARRAAGQSDARLCKSGDSIVVMSPPAEAAT